MGIQTAASRADEDVLGGPALLCNLLGQHGMLLHSASLYLKLCLEYHPLIGSLLGWGVSTSCPGPKPIAASLLLASM